MSALRSIPGARQSRRARDGGANGLRVVINASSSLSLRWSEFYRGAVGGGGGTSSPFSQNTFLTAVVLSTGHDKGILVYIWSIRQKQRKMTENVFQLAVVLT